MPRVGMSGPNVLATRLFPGWGLMGNKAVCRGKIPRRLDCFTSSGFLPFTRLEVWDNLGRAGLVYPHRLRVSVDPGPGVFRYSDKPYSRLVQPQSSFLRGVW